MIISSPPRSSRNTNVGDLLPHFTVVLQLNLRDRLRRRLLEDGLADNIGADSISGEVAQRIYRTQMREAKAVLSFADAMLTWEERRQAELPQPKISIPQAVGEMRKLVGLGFSPVE